MDKGLYLLNALLRKYKSADTPLLARYLPEKEKKELEKPLHYSEDILELNFTNWINEIHYSWLLPLIETLHPIEQTLIKNSLTKKQKKGFLLSTQTETEPAIQSKTGFSGTYSRPITLFFRSFLASKLYAMEKDLLPPQYLQGSALNALLDLDKNSLIKLIDLLGLHDLAAELKTIIDRALLDKIEHALTDLELQFLKAFATQTIKWTPPKLGLESWEGSSKQLHLMLHKRGLYRFARSLSDENSQLVWHICHRLDVGRGKTIYKILLGKQDTHLAAHFKDQVIQIVKNFRKT